MRPRWWSCATADRSASRWFARLRVDTADDEVDDAFRRWLARDPRNERELERRELLWELLGDLKEDPEMMALTKAAAKHAPERRGLSQHDPHRWLRAAITAAAAVSVIAVGLELGRLLKPAQRPSAPAAQEVFSTGIGAQKRVLLADGSQVVLNTDTRLRVQYSADRRLLVLDKGEAVFSVQHDPSRPFDVSAGKTVTRDVGTVFDVYFLPDETTVSVLKGRVQVSAASVRKGRSQVELSAGQAVAYRADAGIGPIAAADLARIGSWQAQRIEFDDVTLREAVADFNRYCTTRVVFQSPSIEGIRVSGVVNFGDVPAFTKALRGAFGIRSQRHGQVVVLLPPLPVRHTR